VEEAQGREVTSVRAILLAGAVGVVLVTPPTVALFMLALRDEAPASEGVGRYQLVHVDRELLLVDTVDGSVYRQDPVDGEWAGYMSDPTEAIRYRWRREEAKAKKTPPVGTEIEDPRSTKQPPGK
jgi:hypothetical protein